MAEETKISWADATWSPWIGCTKVGPECAHCYAERDFDKRRGHAKWGTLEAGGTRVLTSPDYWKKPVAWNKKCESTATRMRVFPSLCDPFEDFKGNVQTAGGNGTLTSLSQVRDLMFNLIDETPWIDWLLLTKRPENIAKFWHGGYRSNVWLGVSAGCQDSVDKMLPPLIEAGNVARWRFVSCEPLLGQVDLCDYLRRIDWVIVGGESGPQSRAMDPVWVRSVRNQCVRYSVPFHFKQWGGPKAGGDALLDGRAYVDVPGAMLG